MANAAGPSPHTVHVPVMGTGFMIDAPLRVAKYGISTVLSLVDDVLIEQMRQYHCTKEGEPYEAIASNEEDARARRITAYLNLVDRLVLRQVEELQASPFAPGSQITRYYELLPNSPLAREYRTMLTTADPAERTRIQERLRRSAVPGSIDVNIMSKGDRDLYRNGEKLPAKYSDALAAIRGYAESTLASSIVLSAGFNPPLCTYAAEFDDFLPGERGTIKKKIILKVSDFRSAAVQGKFLAKRGLWVSEFRVESGLNCGGHAFSTRGLLLGPILEEFQREKTELTESLRAICVKALTQRGRPTTLPDAVRITVQGGIGTAEEDALLREYYDADGTGWATPFLLVPEVTNVDDEHLTKLCEATDADVYLSDSSPFGLPFWNLRNSASEEARRRRIAEGHPGSPCFKGYVQLFNTEFTPTPICTGSRNYQRRKLKQLAADDTLTPQQRDVLREGVLAKACICHDLAGVATVKLGIDPKATPAVCCGPNIVNFSKVASLEEMMGHIYGRISLLTHSGRPHMFLRELAINIDYLRKDIWMHQLGLFHAPANYFQEFQENLTSGIDYYRRTCPQWGIKSQKRFLDELERLQGILFMVVADAAAA